MRNSNVKKIRGPQKKNDKDTQRKRFIGKVKLVAALVSGAIMALGGKKIAESLNDSYIANKYYKLGIIDTGYQYIGADISTKGKEWNENLFNGSYVILGDTTDNYIEVQYYSELTGDVKRGFVPKSQVHQIEDELIPKNEIEKYKYIIQNTTVASVAIVAENGEVMDYLKPDGYAFASGEYQLNKNGENMREILVIQPGGNIKGYVPARAIEQVVEDNILIDGVEVEGEFKGKKGAHVDVIKTVGEDTKGDGSVTIIVDDKQIDIPADKLKPAREQEPFEKILDEVEKGEDRS